MLCVVYLSSVLQIPHPEPTSSVYIQEEEYLAVIEPRSVFLKLKSNQIGNWMAGQRINIKG